MDDRISRRFRASKAATEQGRARQHGDLRGYNGDLKHMFLVRCQRTAGCNRATAKNMNRMPVVKRKRGERYNENQQRVKRMREEHGIPGADRLSNDLPPSRGEMVKNLRELKDLVETDVAMSNAVY